MKRFKLHTFPKILLIVLVIAFFISKLSFNANINQEIDADIYENGTVTGSTSIVMEGTKSKPLITKEEFFKGSFYIKCFENTGKANISTGIWWNFGNKEESFQRILFSSGTMNPFEKDIAPFMLINDTMDQFAIEFADGRILATSDEMYEKYMALPYCWEYGSAKTDGEVLKASVLLAPEGEENPFAEIPLLRTIYKWVI